MAKKLEWNEKCSTCKNCKSNRHERKSNGFCKPCVAYVNLAAEFRKKAIALAAESKQQPPSAGSYLEYHYKTYGPEFLNEVASEAESQLNLRVSTEAYARGEKAPDGLLVEYAFTRIANAIKARDVSYGYASLFSDEFTKEQRAKIFTFLNDMLDSATDPRGKILKRVLDRHPN